MMCTENASRLGRRVIGLLVAAVAAAAMVGFWSAGPAAAQTAQFELEMTTGGDPADIVGPFMYTVTPNSAGCTGTTATLAPVITTNTGFPNGNFAVESVMVTVSSACSYTVTLVDANACVNQGSASSNIVPGPNAIVSRSALCADTLTINKTVTGGVADTGPYTFALAGSGTACSVGSANFGVTTGTVSITTDAVTGLGSATIEVFNAAPSCTFTVTETGTAGCVATTGPFSTTSPSTDNTFTFVNDCPIPTPMPTVAPTAVPTVPPTVTPVPPTVTPTVTPVPPTVTPVPPTVTPVPLTVTPVPPTVVPTQVPPTATAVPPTVVPTQVPPAPLVHDFGVVDPYECGAGFFGEIAGGVAPYSLTYSLTSAAGDVVVLPVVTITEPGGYTTPDGLIDYAAIGGSYAVVLVAVDAAGAELNPAATFDAFITTQCSPVALPTALAAVVSDAGFASATDPDRYGTDDADAIAFGGNAVQSTLDTTTIAAGGGATSAPHTPIAVTGTSTTRPFLIGIALMATGGIFAISGRRRTNG